MRKQNGIAAISGLGQVYVKQGRLDEAVDAFEKVIEIQSDNTDAHFRLAKIT